LFFQRDDGIVVKDDRRSMTTKQYLYGTSETTRRRELRFGVLREPPAPYWGHQSVVLHIARALIDHVEAHDLGLVNIAPIDVVLDEAANLVVQPDVLFVSKDRQSIVHNQVWGAPDLAVEVLSPGTERHDRGEKIALYRRYGVRECWLVDLRQIHIAVVDLTSDPPIERIAGAGQCLRSAVLPDLIVQAFTLLS
jgi:Uma2 family endonuclease